MSQGRVRYGRRDNLQRATPRQRRRRPCHSRNDPRCVRLQIVDPVRQGAAVRVLERHLILRSSRPKSRSWPGSGRSSFEPAQTLAVRTSEARKIPVGVVPSGFVTWNGKSRAVPCTVRSRCSWSCLAALDSCQLSVVGREWVFSDNRELQPTTKSARVNPTVIIVVASGSMPKGFSLPVSIRTEVYS